MSPQPQASPLRQHPLRQHPHRQRRRDLDRWPLQGLPQTRRQRRQGLGRWCRWPLQGLPRTRRQHPHRQRRRDLDRWPLQGLPRTRRSRPLLCPPPCPPLLRQCSTRDFPALAEGRLQARPGCLSTEPRSRVLHLPASARASGCTTPTPGWGLPEQARSHQQRQSRRRSRQRRCRRRLRPLLAQGTGILRSPRSNHLRLRLPTVLRPRRQ